MWTLKRGTRAARNVAADLAVTGWWNRTDQGDQLETGHRVHELDEHMGVANMAGRWMLHSRGHLSLLQQTPLASSLAKTPVTGRFPVNAVRQEPRRGPEIALEDSKCLLVRKRQQGPLAQVHRRRFRPMQQRLDKTRAPPLLQVITPAAGPKRS